ncbi:MAG TPA: alpha/beta hydrolase [Bryobacteraceae bacterium]|nr:alpha/beta hydrolase [Bryobacteraceae bacterium]
MPGWNKVPWNQKPGGEVFLSGPQCEPASGAITVCPLQTVEFQGCRFGYRIDGCGPPLVMIQGIGAFGTAPNPQIGILEGRYRCLSFDNRGIGSSLPAGRPVTVEQMAADTLALMDHAGWESAHIIGHSLGGLIALETALAAKARVRSLTLLCAFADGRDVRRFSPALLWILLRVRFGSRRIRRNAFLDLVTSPEAGQRQRAELALKIFSVLGHDPADIPPITGQQVAAMIKHDVKPRLRELSGVPALVISAEKDLLAPPSAGRGIAAGIQGSRYIEIAGAAHAFPVLEPERCAALMLDHLAAAERLNLPA